jgi:hypothetical protein
MATQIPDTKNAMKSDTIGATDMLQLRILPDGQIEYFKIMDNTVQPYGFGSLANDDRNCFYIGSVDGETRDYYFISGGICSAGITSYTTCKKQINRAAW